MIKDSLSKQRANRNRKVAASAALWLMTSFAVAAETQGKMPLAKVFIQNAYAKYQNLTPGTYPHLLDKAVRSNYFAERFVKALERDERCTPLGDMGALSADIFIAAQDIGERGIGQVDIKALGQNSFEIKFDVFPEHPPAERFPTKVKMQLVMQNGSWRIADIDGALELLEAAPCAADDETER